MIRTCIIASGAYQEPEMEAEFGRIPPSFLPIGNRRLFLRQFAEVAGQADRIFLSLPDGFQPDEVDLALISGLNGEVVSVPEGLSLGQSIVYVINVTASAGGRVSILHGDTLLRGLDWSESDVVSIDAAPAGYRWGRVEMDDGLLVRVCPMAAKGELGEENVGGDVLSGYFSFSDGTLLVQSVMRKGGDFLDGLEEYGLNRPLRTLRAAEWLDFGHANTYHQSRRRITTEREFNRLDPTRRTMVKSSLNVRKIEAEANWFSALPAPMRIHTPAFLGLTDDGKTVGYALEYLHLPTLTDLFVFGRLPRRTWRRIFIACDEFLSVCAANPALPEVGATSRSLYAEKTVDRLETFARTRKVDLSAPCRFGGAWLPSLERIALLAAAAIPLAEPRHLSLVHGDFCFSNILYDARADLVRVIDPRGLDTRNSLTVYGDLRYDLGKLYHSVVGRYDHIMAGYYHISHFGSLDVSLELPDGPTLRGVEAEFHRVPFAGMTLDEAAAPAICVLLFLSMLPLHSDDSDRQDALLANAMRLFLLLDERPKKGKFA